MATKALRPADADETKETAGQGASTSDATGDDAPPAPKTRVRRTKAAGTAEGDAPTPRARRTKAAAPDAGTPDAPEAPKPRARRTKAAAEAAETAAPDAPATAGSVPDDAPAERPARVRATRKKTEPAPQASASPPAAHAESPAAGGPAADAAPDADASDATPRPRRRTRTVAAEPVASSDNLPVDVDGPAANGQARPAEAPPRYNDRPRADDGSPRYDDDDEGGGRRRKRKRNKNKGGAPPQGGQPQGGQPQQGGHSQGGAHPHGGQPQGGAPAEPFDGILELIGDKKFGFVRGFTTALGKGDNDPFMPPPLIQKYNLRDGVAVKGLIRPGRKGAWQVVEVHEVMGVGPDEWAQTPDFEDGMVIYPEEKLDLIQAPYDLSMRVVDLISPIGKGQRALIVAPPRAGKTVLLKGFAEGITKNHPEVKLVTLLIDERPEEVTDFRRNTAATVFASSTDHGEDNHVRVATIGFEYSRRLVEQGHDVVMLLDSLTRLGRTFNLFGGNMSGRTMSGGLDARALLIPRKIFGAARNIEGGGSLTIVATALVETGSRMDDVIFEEFKGTGNSEIVLDRELAEQRIYPAINVRKSGTRNEERLVRPELQHMRHMLLRALNTRHPVEAMQALTKQIVSNDTNEDLLQALVPD